MDRQSVIRPLKAHEAELRAHGANALFLFGSTARDSAGPDSDVDLFLDYGDPRFSLIDQIKLESYLSALLGTRVDLTTRGGLHPLLRSDIEASAFRVF